MMTEQDVAGTIGILGAAAGSAGGRQAGSGEGPQRREGGPSAGGGDKHVSADE